MIISVKKLFFVPVALLIVISIGLLISLIFQPNHFVIPEEECSVNIEERIIRGNSLAPLIKDGQAVRVLFGYYECHEIKREDLVLYDYAGSENPLIKIIKGVPGDKLELKKVDAGWNILINSQVLKNSENQPYLLNQRSYNLLSLYEKDYQGVILEQVYLIMGNLVGGTMDSTRYGLVHKNNILARAEKMGSYYLTPEVE